MSTSIDEALDYLKSGILDEVEAQARTVLATGRVAGSASVGVALCMLAREAIQWPERHDSRVAELLDANNIYLERARAAEAESARQAKIINRLTALLEGWRDIRSAPKDGTFFLARRGAYRPAIVAWQTHDGLSRFGDDPESFMEGDHFLNYWHECNYEPTEWMPLPGDQDEDVAETDDYPQCLACEKQLHEGALYFPDVSGVLCAECAPTYRSLVDEPQGHVHLDNGEPRPAEDCRAEFEAHIAAGGEPGDRMARAVLE